MKLILNVSADPHFVALFDDQNQLLAQQSWNDFRAGGQIVWDFLANHKIGSGVDLTFVGGISGPGGFSTLRVGGAIINALSFRFDLPVHQVRADALANILIGSNDFVLNSFGSGVFIADGTDLERVETTIAVEKFQQKPMFVDWLPVDKKEKFMALKIDKDVVEATLEVLLSAPERKVFLPDYEYPPVQ